MELREWYQNGKLHRDDGPAAEWSNGTKKWYQNGKLHRDDGPAIEYIDGDKEWYQNGLKHRIDGPAVNYNNYGTKEWYQNGLKHRIDGPAVENRDGFNVWYLDNIHYSEEEYKRKIRGIRYDVYQKWFSDYTRSIKTKRGYKFLSREYYKMLDEIN